MKIDSVADVKAKLSTYVKASERGPVVITRNGKAIAALVFVTGEDEIGRLMMSRSPPAAWCRGSVWSLRIDGNGIRHESEIARRASDG